MKFTQIPSNTFSHLQMNAGILVDSFQPDSGVIGNIIGATTGGITFTDNVTYTDFGDDIDNCPKNMLELKRVDSHDVTMGGTFVTVDSSTAKLLAGASDVDRTDASHIIPRNDLSTSDFTTLWWIGDYSNENTGDNAGFLAIRLINALNTGGFQIRSTDKGKGQFAFTFTGHYSMNAQDTVPYEIYVKEGGNAVQIVLNQATATVAVGSTVELEASVSPDTATITWESNATNVATVSDAGVVTGVAVGDAIITATATSDEETAIATCNISVVAGA